MFPVWLLAVLILFAFTLTIFSYSGYKTLSPLTRTLLISLRLTAFALLFFVLLNPKFERITELNTKPVISVLIDDTQSMAIEKNEWTGITSARNLVDNIERILGEAEVEVNWHRFDRQIHPVESIDQFTFDKSGTDIFHVLSDYEQSARSDAIILVTDGISTTGRSPEFAGRIMTRPVWTVAAGDTTLQRDLILQGIDHPATAFINADVALTATLRNDGFPQETIRIRLLDRGVVIQEKEIQTISDRSTHQVEFLVSAESEGLRTYTVEIEPKDGEWTTQNNVQRFSIDFKDGVLRVLHLAFEIHPDIGALRSILETNPAVSLTPLTWIRGDRFLEGMLPAQTDTFDLVIFHGFPSNSGLEPLLTRITQEVSTMFILTPTSTSVGWNTVTESVTGRPTVLFERGVQSIQPRPSAEQAGHPVIALPPVEFNRMPVLQSPSAGITPSGLGTSLMYASFRGERTTTPILTLSQTGNYRHSFLLAYGFHMWLLQADEAHSEWMKDLLSNLVVWTATKTGDDLFTINTSVPEFDTAEPVLFNADVRDESGNPESNADIALRVRHVETQEERQFTLISAGRGRYNLNIGPMPEGSYEFSAESRVGTQFLGSQNGSFQVGNSMVELINTQRNDQALRQIARASGGEFLTFNSIEQLPLLVSSLKESRQQEFLRIPGYVNRSLWWLVLLLIVLGSEWLIRKRYALP